MCKKRTPTTEIIKKLSIKLVGDSRMNHLEEQGCENPLNYNLNKINKVLNKLNKRISSIVIGYNRIKYKMLW